MKLHRYVRATGLTALAVLIPGSAAVTLASPTVAAVAAPVRTPAQLVRLVHDKQKSTNWSGYAVSGTGFTDVVGTWTEPAVKCGTAAQYASFWVGIDGYTSTSVEQLGTDSDCSGGKGSYYGWYEMYPANSVNLSRSQYPVKPGDKLTAEVKVTGTTFTLSMKSSAGWSFSIKKTSSTVKRSSAEWIIESPEICGSSCKLAKLADFGKLSFSAAEAATTGGDEPISSFTGSSGPHELTMTASNKTTVRAQPSALGSTGETFVTTWKHS